MVGRLRISEASPSRVAWNTVGGRRRTNSGTECACSDAERHRVSKIPAKLGKSAAMVMDFSCGNRIYRRLIARDNAKSAAMAAKECVQVIEATHVARERCRRGYDAQLIVVRVETKAVEQHPRR
jgi:hypothetical protein